MNMQCKELIDGNDRIDKSSEMTEAMQLDMDEIMVKSSRPIHDAIYACDTKAFMPLRII
jgi:hypothetical protein